MYTPRLSRTLAVGIAAVLISACGAASAPASSRPAPAVDGAPAPAAPVSISLADGKLAAPAELPAGMVTLDYTRSDPPGYIFELVRLAPGKTVEDFKQVYMAESLPDDPSQTAALLGGAHQGKVTYKLTPGSYVAVAGSSLTDVYFSPISVKDTGQSAVTPQATVEATMEDNTYALPETISAGKHTWQITNNGEQPHHMLVVLPQPGITGEDFAAWATAPQGPPPWQDDAGAQFGTLSPGETSWAEIELPAGAYQLICMLPGPDGVSHVAAGMHRTLTVTP